MKINEVVKEVHSMAKKKGWYDGTPRTALEIHALIHSEISEAIELADAIIRIMDYFGYKNWNLEEILNIKIQYNKTRAYRHGNKKF